MSAPLVIFKAINNSSQQQELLQKLLADQMTILLKLPEGQELELKPMSLNSALQIKCQYQGSYFPEGLSVVLIMHFSLGAEKYMSEVQVQSRQNLLLLGVLNLFHLQRRRNFRYILPPNHPGFFKLKTVGERISPVSMELIDISAEGCAVRVAQGIMDMSVGDELTGEIHLEKQKSILVVALLQNIRPSGDEHFTLGLKFNHVTQNREGDIVQALTLLQRSLYLKRAA